MNTRPVAGFTLMEMAIVLVIIGLIVGGVVLGRALLTTSQLQTVATDADNYITAVNNFKQQYQALPGDMPTATAQWGVDSSGCNSGEAPVARAPATVTARLVPQAMNTNLSASGSTYITQECLISASAALPLLRE